MCSYHEDAQPSPLVHIRYFSNFFQTNPSIPCLQLTEAIAQVSLYLCIGETFTGCQSSTNSRDSQSCGSDTRKHRVIGVLQSLRQYHGQCRRQYPDVYLSD
jgi:hypothetical protein